MIFLCFGLPDFPKKNLILMEMYSLLINSWSFAKLAKVGSTNTSTLVGPTLVRHAS